MLCPPRKVLGISSWLQISCLPLHPERSRLGKHNELKFISQLPTPCSRQILTNRQLMSTKEAPFPLRFVAVPLHLGT